MPGGVAIVLKAESETKSDIEAILFADGVKLIGLDRVRCLDAVAP